jgi:hypothetical protein
VVDQLLEEKPVIDKADVDCFVNVKNEIDRLELIGLINPNDENGLEKATKNLESGKFFNESL